MSPGSHIVQPKWEELERLRKKDQAEFEASIKGLKFMARVKARIRFWMKGSPNHRVWIR